MTVGVRPGTGSEERPRGRRDGTRNAGAADLITLFDGGVDRTVDRDGRKQ